MTTAVPDAVSRTASSTDPLALIDVDHVRFWVGNAKQAAYFYASAFGFQLFQGYLTGRPRPIDEIDEIDGA